MSKRLEELKKEAEKARGQKISVANNSMGIADNHLKSLDVAPKTSLQDELMASTQKPSLTNRLKAIPTATSYSGNGFTSGMMDIDTAPNQYSTGTGVADKIGNFAKRLDNGLWGIHEGLGASLGLAEDTLKQSNEANIFNNLLKNQLENQKNAASQIDYLKNYKNKGDTVALQADPEYVQAVKKLQSNSRVINAVRNTPMDANTQAFQDYALANSYKEKAVEGLSPTGKFIGNTAMSIGDNIAALPTVAINPNMPLAILGAKGAANKIYDVGNNGGTASEALTRGIVSGGIEAATEKIGLDNLMKFGMGGAAKNSSGELFKQFLKNASKQSAIEGAEEGLSYIGNYGADKTFGDQNAKFDVKELGLSALGGALSGAVMGGGASLFGNGATNSRVAEKNALQAEWENQQAELKSQLEKQQAEQAAYRQNVKNYADQQLKNNVPLLGRGADFTVDADGTIVPVSNNASEVVSSEGNPNIQKTKEVFDTKAFNKGNFLDFEEGSTPNLSVREKSLIDSLVKSAESKGIEPQRMAEIMISNTNKAVDSEVAELATVMQNYKPQGVQQILMPDMDNNRNSVLGNKFARISNNEKWYSDLYQRTKRKPTVSQIKDYARELIEADLQKGGGEYVSNELAQNYNTAQALSDAVSKVFTGQGKVLGIEDTGGGYAVQYGRNRQEVVPDYRVRNGRQALVNRDILYENKKRGLNSRPVNGLQLSEMAVESDPTISIHQNEDNNNFNRNTKVDVADTSNVVVKLKNNIPEISKMEPVARLTGQEFPKGDRRLTEQVGDFFRTLGNKVTRKNFGEVILDENGINDSIAHGLGRAKSVTFAAVPEVIKNGKQIDYQENWKNRNYDTYVFAAPVNIGNNTGYVAAVVMKKKGGNRYYLHEVLNEAGEVLYLNKKNGTEDVFKTGSISTGTPTVPSTSTNTSIYNSTPKSNNYSAEQVLFNNKYGKNTVGSAEANPDSLQSLADRYGQIPEGENPKARVAVLPTQIDDSGKKVSEAARTFIEAGAITDETASAIEDSVLNGDYSHEVITDKEANVKALNTLRKAGFAEALDRWNSAYENGGATKFDLALAQRLMAEASQAGNSKVANQIGVQMATELTRSGQLLQANRMLKRLSPEGMVTFAETQINQLKGELADKGIDQKIIDKVNLTDEDITFIYDTMQAVEGMPDGREKTVALAQVKARIENKIPSSAGNKLKTLARMSMLFNPKTQVRNVMGNAIISLIAPANDVIGTAVDKAVYQKTGQRTTSMPQPSALKGMKQGIGEAVEDYKLGINTRDIEGNRFEIGQGKSFNDTRFNSDKLIGKIGNFPAKLANTIDRTTNFMLDAGDRGFYETWFNNSLSQQMKANKVDVPTEEMIKIAKNEALKRTWQDTNNYTETVSKLRNALNNLNVKGYGLGDMTLPFIKTPANLTKALVDYSPVGVIKTLKVDANNLKTAMKTGKDVAQTQRTFVDNLSKGITGTLLMVLYSALADKGILKGEGNKDKDLAGFEKNILGIQPYSVVIGDKSYSYEWAQPVGGSMAMVTDFKKAFKEADTDKGELSAYSSAILEGISASGKVLFNQSFATGISNLFGEDDIINGLMEVALNEPSKFTSQLMGQFAQLGDGTARSTYVYGDPMATAGNKVKAKVPGKRNELPPVVDVMGNEVKSNNSVFDVFFNPANYYSDVSDDGANEIYSIYQATGDKTVIPPTAPYYVMYKNNKTVLTPEQKAEYQKTTGSIVSTSVNSLIKDNGYMSLSDTAKAELLNDIYGYANAMAKDKFVKGYELKAAEEKIKTAEQNGIEPFEYLLLKQTFGNIDPTDTMNGSEENKAKRDLLYGNDTMSSEQKALMDSMLISDGMYLPEEKNVDYSNSDSFTLTQMSETAQKKWDRAKGLGYTVEEYEQYYPVVMSGKKKAEVLADLQMNGLSYSEASTLYAKMKAK